MTYTFLRKCICISAILSFQACAKVNDFNVEPLRACPGGYAKVQWNVDGSAHLNSAPPVQGSGPLPSSGDKQLKIDKPTLLTLTAETFLNSVHREQKIETELQSAGLRDAAHCDHKSKRLLTRIVLKENRFSLRVVVNSVKNDYWRPLIVKKDSRYDLFPTKHESFTFKGVPVQGVWEVSAPLNPGETCNEALRSVRQALTINITYSCEGR